MIHSREIEFAKTKAELDKLALFRAEKEQIFEELARTVAKFQHRYSAELGAKQEELNRLREELGRPLVKNSPYYYSAVQKSQISDSDKSINRSIETNKEVTVEKRPVFHSAQDAKEAKRMYRKIASLIHPDKAAECKSRPFRTQLMAELNEAYAQKDTIKMQSILHQWQQSPEAVEGEGSDAEFERAYRTLVQLKKRIFEIDAETARIVASDIYLFMVKVQKGDEAGRDILKEMSLSLDTQIQDAKNKLFLRMYG